MSTLRVVARPVLFLLPAVLLLVGAAEPPSPPVVLSPQQAEKEGRALIAELLSQRPTQDYTNGVMKIRDAKGHRMETPVRFQIVTPPLNSSNWMSIYETTAASNKVNLRVVHSDNQPNVYRLTENGAQRNLGANETMVPFAGSDFWVADLGLEFFHWPQQRLLKTEMRRSRSCRVLESINPRPGPGDYARVVSWIDIESHGIVFAEAYDARNKLLKEFAPKDVKKVNGQWQLLEMEISNRQTGSRTRIEFNSGSP